MTFELNNSINSDILSAYLPMDRRFVLAKKKNLPEFTNGAALFADISGFTSLTESMSLELGPKRGAEELTVHLNRVYDAIINELHNFGGSVIGFSGDAITCWLDGDDGLQAVSCALAMQKAMRSFRAVLTAGGNQVHLAVKIAVATGDVRRFLVGDPKIKVFEVLCGDTINRLATSEHQAQRGEVVLDSKTAAILEETVEFSEWREAEPTQRIAIVKEIKPEIIKLPQGSTGSKKLTNQQVRPWLLKAVYDRLLEGKGEFLAELRPAVALFVRFNGIDFQFESDTRTILDDYICRVQRILKDYDGTLIQLTIGDKGSYFYAAFGAPFAHEDDPIRAVRAAHDLRAMSQEMQPRLTVQIGISVGQMRVGAYGATESRTYGVLGDAVNLAARLMQHAEEGEILATNLIHNEALISVIWQKMEAIYVKGKQQPVDVFRFLKFNNSAELILDLQSSVSVIGRELEIGEINRILAKISLGKGQVLGITGDAGIGKSLLNQELINDAMRQGWTVFGGECQSYGINASYLVWQSIWQKFFGYSPSDRLDQQIEIISLYLARVDSKLVQRLPLLGGLLNLPIPENDLTLGLDAKIRKSSLEGLLVDCLSERAQKEPLIFVLEDVHWIDPLSHDLLETLCKAIVNLPVLMVLVYRPAVVERLKKNRVSGLPYFNEVNLRPLTSNHMQELVRQKFSRVMDKKIIPEALVHQIVKKAEGNPFYADQIIDYFMDSGLTLSDLHSIQKLQLPSNLQSLVLSRIDQLTESQKITLKMASVIGRLFKESILWGVYAWKKGDSQIQEDLVALTRFELGEIQEQDEHTYFFRHILTHEVAYESLPYATRSLLHEQIGDFLEKKFSENQQQYLDLLCFHYNRSENRGKKIEYLLKAGDSAKHKYANDAAIEYYLELLNLLDDYEKIEVYLKISQVYEVLGQWDVARQFYRESFRLAIRYHNPVSAARSQAGLGELYRKQGNYTAANRVLLKARNCFENLNYVPGIAQSLQSLGSLATQQGKMQQAMDFYQQSLLYWQELDEKHRVASLYSNLGIVARLSGDNAEAQKLHEKGLIIRRQLSNRWAIAVSLNNLGNVAIDQGNLQDARNYLEEAVELQKEVGDKYYIANALNNLGNVSREQGEFKIAYGYYCESLELNRTLGDRWALAYLLEDIGYLACKNRLFENALFLVEAASVLRELIHAPLSTVEVKKMDENLLPARKTLSGDEQQKIRQTGRSSNLDEAINLALKLF